MALFKVNHVSTLSLFLTLLCIAFVGMFSFNKLLTTTLLSLTASISLFFHFRHQTHSTLKSSSLALPPGPQPWSVIGNLPELMMSHPRYKWIMDLVQQMKTDIVCFRLFRTHVIIVNSSEIAREFLKTHDDKFSSRPITMGTEHSSHGFLSVVHAPYGDQWKKMRKVVAAHVINSAKLKWLHDKREQEADNLVGHIFRQCMGSNLKNGAVVNVRTVSRAYSGNVIRRLMFNKRYFNEATTDGVAGLAEEEHLEALFTVLHYLFAFCVSDYMPSLRWLDLDGHEKTMKAAMKIVNRYHDPIIFERIQATKGGSDNMEPDDMLDVLISLRDENGMPLLSTQEIRAQIVDLTMASVDGPAYLVEWALAEMMNQPDILQKAISEIDMVVGRDRLVQETDVAKLNYAKACIREVFRLHPIGPFNLPHVALEDTNVAGYLIPKGSHVFLNRIGIGRQPKVWEDPLKFNPDRHLDPSNPDQQIELIEPDLRFISFSTGRRGCMGAPLGTLMTIMLLGRLLQGFNWAVPAGDSKVDLTESKHDLFLAKPLHLSATPRLPAHMYPEP